MIEAENLTKRKPVDLGSATGFTGDGYRIDSQFISPERCTKLLAMIDEYRQHNILQIIHRPALDRPLHYSVIDGESIGRSLPHVNELYREVNAFVNEISGRNLAPLKDEKVACNINITSKGGSYRWHYDRNAVTAILYLNDVEGGETDCYPNYRIPGKFGSNFQRLLDRILQTAIVRRIFGKLVVIEPQAGRMLVMQGDRCLHSVRPVIGDTDRVNIIMSFDVPGRDFAVADQLNDYLYKGNTSSSRDPNYT